MKNLFLTIVVVISSLSSFAGVDLKPYTDTLRAQNNWSKADVGTLQFYVSHDIVLRKKVAGDTSAIVNHKVVTKNIKDDSTIVIKAGTPAIITEWLEDSTVIRVRFSSDTSHALNFKQNLTQENGRYLIEPVEDWRGNIGKFLYAGSIYYSDKDSRFVNLKVDVSQLNKHKSKTIKEKGAKF